MVTDYLLTVSVRKIYSKLLNLLINIGGGGGS